MVLMGLMLFWSMALLTPFLQNVLGYPITVGGLAAGLTRHRHAGRHDARSGGCCGSIEARYLILIGLSLTAVDALGNDRLHQQHLGARHRRSAG